MWRLAGASIRRRALAGSAAGGRILPPSHLTRAAAAIGASDDNPPFVRNFSRRPKAHLDDPQEESLEEKEAQATKENEGSVAAWDMEFLDDRLAGSDDPGYHDNGEDDDEELAARLDEAYRQKQEEIQRELDSREGRPWKDPWAIQEEQWMSTAGFDDLPDWSPDRVSRISQERVQILPGA